MVQTLRYRDIDRLIHRSESVTIEASDLSDNEAESTLFAAPGEGKNLILRDLTISISESEAGVGFGVKAVVEEVSTSATSSQSSASTTSSSSGSESSSSSTSGSSLSGSGSTSTSSSSTSSSSTSQSFSTSSSSSSTSTSSSSSSQSQSSSSSSSESRTSSSSTSTTSSSSSEDIPGGLASNETLLWYVENNAANDHDGTHTPYQNSRFTLPENAALVAFAIATTGGATQFQAIFTSTVGTWLELA